MTSHILVTSVVLPLITLKSTAVIAQTYIIQRESAVSSVTMLLQVRPKCGNTLGSTQWVLLAQNVTNLFPPFLR